MTSRRMIYSSTSFHWQKWKEYWSTYDRGTLRVTVIFCNWKRPRYCNAYGLLDVTDTHVFKPFQSNLHWRNGTRRHERNFKNVVMILQTFLLCWHLSLQNVQKTLKLYNIIHGLIMNNTSSFEIRWWSDTSQERDEDFVMNGTDWFIKYILQTKLIVHDCGSVRMMFLCGDTSVKILVTNDNVTLLISWFFVLLRVKSDMLCESDFETSKY